MSSPLSKFETFSYFAIWIGGVSASLFHLYSLGKESHHLRDAHYFEDFKRGWNILGGRYQDQSDYEWNSWSRLTLKLIPFLLCNLLVAELIRMGRNIRLLPVWYATVTLTFVSVHFNIATSLWYLTLALAYYACLVARKRALVWIVTFVILHLFQPYHWLISNHDQQYLLVISSCWMILRCISFCTDKLDDLSNATVTEHRNEVIDLLGYSLYLPTMFCGPFVLHSNFNREMNLAFESWNARRLSVLAVKFARCCLWYLFTQFALHFIYVNAILLRPRLVKQMSDWQLAGLGIAMGHFYHLKYVVFYGLPCAWAAAERYSTPESPCCVSRIHLYSNMWRRFDQGFYHFLRRYIYLPVSSAIEGSDLLRRTAASVACFVFVFVWHGEQDYVFYWASFNFLGMTAEAFARRLSRSKIIRSFLTEKISRKNSLRLHCLLAAPLHYCSMVSNYFFVGNGMQVGLVYRDRLLHGSLKSTLTVLFFLYGAGQSAVATQMFEESRNGGKDKRST